MLKRDFQNKTKKNKNMILRRLGNKSKISEKIHKLFPKHEIYIEPFFGAGGMFFNKPKAKYNIVNDIDADVFNLFMVVMNDKEALREAFFQMPIHKDLLNYYKNNEEQDPVKKAIRFLFLSNLTYLGKGQTLQFGSDNGKLNFNFKLNKTFEILENVKFDNSDFRTFLNKNIAFGTSGFSCLPEKCFIYCDPPYLGTDNNYSNSFTKEDVVDLFDCLEATKCKFAVSEFDHEFILEEAERRGLVVNYIGERQNLKNRRSEILITNYQARHTLF